MKRLITSGFFYAALTQLTTGWFGMKPDLHRVGSIPPSNGVYPPAGNQQQESLQGLFYSAILACFPGLAVPLTQG
jgi:hypothetical protein